MIQQNSTAWYNNKLIVKLKYILCIEYVIGVHFMNILCRVMTWRVQVWRLRVSNSQCRIF